MKKITIILASVLTVVVAGIIACNSGDGLSKNKEGIMEITGPADKEVAPVDTTKQFSPI